MWVFREQTERVLLVGKAVRIISGIRAAMTLADLGFIAECGSILRTVSEYTGEILSICQGLLTGPQTEAQRRFLRQYFAPMPRDPDEEQDRYVTREELFKGYYRWAAEKGGDYDRARKVFRFVLQGYDKFVHGAYITAMELYNGRDHTFMLSGHESEDKKNVYKAAVAAKLHESLSALLAIATVTGIPALETEIGLASRELYASGEISGGARDSGQSSE